MQIRTLTGEGRYDGNARRTRRAWTKPMSGAAGPAGSAVAALPARRSSWASCRAPARWRRRSSRTSRKTLSATWYWRRSSRVRSFQPKLYSYGLLTGDGYRRRGKAWGKKTPITTTRLGRTPRHSVEGSGAVQSVDPLDARPDFIKAHGQVSSEFTFRANHRAMVNGMVDVLIGAL